MTITNPKILLDVFGQGRYEMDILVMSSIGETEGSEYLVQSEYLVYTFLQIRFGFMTRRKSPYAHEKPPHSSPFLSVF